MHKGILSRIEIFVNLKNPLRKSKQGYIDNRMNTKKISASTNQTPNSPFQQPETSDRRPVAGNQYRASNIPHTASSIPAETGSPFHSDQQRGFASDPPALHHSHLHSPCRLPPPMRLLQSDFDYGCKKQDGHPG